jgi:hypothetical protein
MFHFLTGGTLKKFSSFSVEENRGQDVMAQVVLKDLNRKFDEVYGEGCEPLIRDKGVHRSCRTIGVQQSTALGWWRTGRDHLGRLHRRPARLATSAGDRDIAMVFRNCALTAL